MSAHAAYNVVEHHHTKAVLFKAKNENINVRMYVVCVCVQCMSGCAEGGGEAYNMRTLRAPLFIMFTA